MKQKIRGSIKVPVEFDVVVNEEGFIEQMSAPKEFTQLLKKFEYVEVQISKVKKNETTNSNTK